MRRLRVLLTVFLLAGILLCATSVAYADDGDGDGPDVTVIATGDDVNMNAAVIGDNSQWNIDAGNSNDVNINGQNLSQFGNSGGYGDAGTQFQSWQNKEAIEWLMGQLTNTNSYLGLTANGVAKLITELQAQGKTLEESVQWISANKEELGAIANQLNSYSTRLTVMGNNTFSLWQEVNALKQQNEVQAQLLAKLESQNQAERFAGGGLAAVLLIGIVTLTLWRRR